MGKRLFQGVLDSVNRSVHDLMLEHAPITVKTCQDVIHRSGSVSGERVGRFGFNKYDHHELIAKNGIYVFIVFSSCQAARFRFIPAERIPYQRQYSWRAIWEGGYAHAV